MRYGRVNRAKPHIAALAAVVKRSEPRRASLPPNPLLVGRKRAVSDPPAVEKILAGRRSENERTWRAFCAAGLTRAWEFLHEKPCTCPDLELEASIFRKHLGLWLTQWSGRSELEDGIEFKIERAERHRRMVESKRSWALEAYGRGSRRALMALACPPWADRFAIREVYRKCKQMNAETGTPTFSVDHIVPLQGRTVCGLHVRENLRIITAIENSRKSNDFYEALALAPQAI